MEQNINLILTIVGCILAVVLGIHGLLTRDK